MLSPSGRLKHGSPRVLHVLEATLGGTRRYLGDLCEASVGLDVVPALAYSEERADEQFRLVKRALVDAGWALFPIHMVRRIDPVVDVASVVGLRAVIAAFEPTVVHAHSSKAGGIARLAAQTVRRRPAVFYSPHALSGSMGKHYLRIERGLARITRRFVAVSASEKREIVAYGLAADDGISIVPPIVDGATLPPVDRAAARARLSLEAGPLVVAIGRLDDQKDPLGFLALFKEVRARLPGVRAIWVGDGILREAVAEAIRRDGLSDIVSITGWIDDVRDYVAAADVVVSTARFESFGYAVAEALAMAVPVVATAVTGTVDVMAELPEWTFSYGDWKGGAELVRRLLLDEALRRNVGAFGRGSVTTCFSREAMTESLRELYATVP